MSTPGPGWHRVGPAAELEVEDVMPFEFNNRELKKNRSPTVSSSTM
jgi:hypothetical protein